MFIDEILKPLITIVSHCSMNNAFCINNKYYSYIEFAQSISKIRIALRNEKIERKHVGLVTNDDIDTYASIFAIWLEGGAYVPLNPGHPAERNNEIIKQASIILILDSSSTTEHKQTRVISTRNLLFSDFDLSLDIFSDDLLAYILYTSGSTGKPKGVAITRKNIASFVKSYWDNGYEFFETDRCLQPFDLSFDLSIISFLFPVIKGACVYTVPPNHIKYTYIIELLEKYSITIVIMVPSMIRYLKPYFDEIELPQLRYNQFCGEGLAIELIEKWSKCIPNAIIENIYGPTENTIICSYYRYNREGGNKTYNGILSIGKPMTKRQMIILNDKDQEVGNNEMGELCVQGKQLMQGYWNDSIKNNEVFFYDKLGRRFYRTGDICYRDENGDYMYCGRKDFQIKVQGYRVELGEIEYHIREYLNDISFVTLGFSNSSGNSEIALFVEQEEIDRKDLLHKLKNKVPSYMLPTKIICQKRFPLNSNGKIDRSALKSLLSL